MQDFLGQEINVGDFVAFPGKGNVAAEYGLLILKITKFEKGKVFGLRFDTIYNKPENGGYVNILKKTNITNHNKLVKVNPPQFIIDAFNRIFHSEGMSERHNIQPELSQWTHGNDSFTW